MGHAATKIKNKRERHVRDKEKEKKFKNTGKDRTKKKSAIEELWRNNRDGPKDERKRTRFKNFIWGDPVAKKRAKENPIVYRDEDRKKEDKLKDKRRKSSLGNVLAKHSRV